jgi:hypothetical protein
LAHRATRSSGRDQASRSRHTRVKLLACAS